MATYKFPDQWETEITDPVITFYNVDVNGDPKIEEVDKASMTINVSILMTTPSTKFLPNINPIPVENMDYSTAANVMERVMDRLADFEV